MSQRKCVSRKAVGRKRGFTLIELLIVILIIGVLAGLTVRVVKVAQRKAAVAKAASMVRALNDGLQMYHEEKGYLPGRNEPAGTNVISEVIAEIRGSYARINEEDLGVIDAEDEPPRPATREEIDDPDVPKVVIDPWGWSYIAHENESKEKKEPWMRNKDFIDIYSMGPNEKDDTFELVEGAANDDIGNW